MESKRESQSPDQVRALVRERYAQAAQRQGSCCGPSQACCGGSAGREVEQSVSVGYQVAQLDLIPEGANLGLGCGNPTALATLKPGEVVLDLGSGAGIDVFLAARQVGPEGLAIGVDMTDAMLARARETAARHGYRNVDFRKGQIEALPVEDASVDVVISNCVINLSPEKPKVFAETFRVLRPGGRLQVSDIVLDAPLPPAVAESVEAYVGCIAGASLRGDYLAMIEAAGFSEVQVVKEASFADAVSADDPMVQEAMARFGVGIDEVRAAMRGVTSVSVLARKPDAA